MSIHRYLLFLLLPLFIYGQQNSISIAFQDLPALLAEASSKQRIIEMRKSMTVAEQQDVLQWSNPQIHFQHEFIENNALDETEQQLYLSKTFSMPWNYWLQRDISQTHIKAAELQARQESKNLRALAQTAYIRLSLLQSLNVQQKQLSQAVQNMKNVVQAQNDEGALSTTNAHLLNIMLLGLQGDILNTKNEKLRQETSLKELLDFSQTQNIDLTTNISYVRLSDDFQAKLELNDEMAILKTGLTRLQALDKGVTLEKGRILDNFSLSGGWKKVEPGWEGYTIGLSIPLPFLNWNGPQIQQQKIAREMQLVENRIKRKNVQNKTANLLAMIKGYQEIFAVNKDLYNINLIENLSAAWQEGSLTLNEFLNAIQIYRLGVRQNTEQLVSYYKALFELEALFDIDLVTL